MTEQTTALTARTRFTVRGFSPMTGELVEFHENNQKIAERHSDRLQDAGFDNVNLIDWVWTPMSARQESDMTTESRFDQLFLNRTAEAFDNLRFMVMEAVDEGGIVTSLSLSSALGLPVGVVRAIILDAMSHCGSGVVEVAPDTYSIQSEEGEV